MIWSPHNFDFFTLNQKQKQKQKQSCHIDTSTVSLIFKIELNWWWSMNSSWMYIQSTDYKTSSTYMLRVSRQVEAAEWNDDDDKKNKTNQKK